MYSILSLVPTHNTAHVLITFIIDFVLPCGICFTEALREFRTATDGRLETRL